MEIKIEVHHDNNKTKVMKENYHKENWYDRKMQEFLDKTGTKFSIKFLKHGTHFIGEKETRDIYEVTLERGSRSFTFNFGNSIDESGFYIKRGNQKIDIPRKHLNEKDFQIRRLMRVGQNWTKNDYIHRPKTPTAYDVLSVLTTTDPVSHEEFCFSFGYDTDSIKGLKIYEAVSDEYKNMAMLFSDEELEEIQQLS